MENFEMIIAWFLLCFSCVALGWETRALYDKERRARARRNRKQAESAYKHARQ